MATGPFTVLNIAKPKFSANAPTFNLAADTFNMALTTSSQVLSASFTGSSGAGRYADLTAEVAAGSGYSTGGVALTGVTWTGGTGSATFTSAAASWTLTGSGITFKYGVIYDNTLANKDILCFFDVNAGGGSLSPSAGVFSINVNTNGIFSLT